MKVEVIKILQEGGRVEPSDLLDALAPYFPLISEMEATPQDPEWHAEGNVRIHTEMVIEEAYEVVADHGLKGDVALALILSAALHDVGKTLTTREEKQQGRIRITSPRHAARGRSYAALRISALGLKRSVMDLVLAGIGHHHDPRKLVSRRQRSNGRYWRLARIVDPWFIYLLEIADLKGRTNVDKGNIAFDTLGLFKLAAEEAGVWRKEDPYSNWRDAILLGGFTSNL